MNLLMAFFTPASVIDEPDARVRAEALAWVNMIREEYRLEACPSLLPGVRRSITDCVIARMLQPIAPRVTVGPTEFVQRVVSIRQWDGGCVYRPCPPLVVEFLRRFDLGLFPDLVETNLLDLLAVQGMQATVATLQVT